VQCVRDVGLETVKASVTDENTVFLKPGRVVLKPLKLKCSSRRKESEELEKRDEDENEEGGGGENGGGREEGRTKLMLEDWEKADWGREEKARI